MQKNLILVAMQKTCILIMHYKNIFIFVYSSKGKKN